MIKLIYLLSILIFLIPTSSLSEEIEIKNKWLLEQHKERMSAEYYSKQIIYFDHCLEKCLETYKHFTYDNSCINDTQCVGCFDECISQYESILNNNHIIKLHVREASDWCFIGSISGIINEIYCSE